MKRGTVRTTVQSKRVRGNPRWRCPRCRARNKGGHCLHCGYMKPSE